MPKATTPSFVTQIPLKVSNKEIAVLKKRFRAAKQQYNALLGDALKRLDKMRSDKRFKQAKELYKEKGKKGEAKVLLSNLERVMVTENMICMRFASSGIKKEIHSL